MTDELNTIPINVDDPQPERPNLLGILVDILETLLLSVVLFS